MVTLIKRRFGDKVPELNKRTIGNALVVHHGERMSEHAYELALAVAEDPEHDFVVVDLPVDMPISVWESVANAMPRRRRGVRVVIDGRSRETGALASRWLSERLGRTVIAPDGTVTVGADGSLFIHSGRGSGWVQFEPGRSPRWLAKRFPQPSWESPVIAEELPTSARGLVEPLPSGLWIRPTEAGRQQELQRAQLIRTMPLQKDIMTIVLGAPEGVPLTIDDPARLWMQVPEQIRRRIRFVQYGPMALPKGATLGQALADLLGSEVAFYTGLPTGSPQAPVIQTVRPGGALVWPAYARELGYRPRTPGSPVPLPVLLSHRVPLAGLEEVAPAVYRYAPDAVVEVMQTGLLVRGPSERGNTHVLRTLTLDPEINNVTFDASGNASDDRMRQVAEDLLGRLDYTTRRVSRLLAAPALLAERSRVHPGGPALATVEDGASASASAVAQPGQNLPEEQSVDAPGSPHLVSPASRPGGPVFAAPVDLPGNPEQHELSRAVAPAGPQESSQQTSAPLLAEQCAPTRPLPMLPTPSIPSDAPLAPAGFRLESRGGPQADGAAGPPVLPGADPVPEPVPAAEPGPGLSASTPGGAPDAGVADVPLPSADPSPHHNDTRLQPAPSPEAAALLPPRGLDEEREWVRKALGGEYGIMANAVARVLAEHPGFQGEMSRNSTDALTDAVAVRLYLSPKGEGIDRALRAAAVGAHVPIARCVVAGLSRLPSHRGPSMFTASPTPEQWALYRDSRLLTEWSFLHAFASPHADLGGTTDVLLWSISGRRTRLLELDGDPVEDRVVFVPGTSFKVLGLKEAGAGARGLILLRELALSEIDETGQVDPNRAALDDLALRSLQQELEKWAGFQPQHGISRTAAARFGALPGLV